MFFKKYYIPDGNIHNYQLANKKIITRLSLPKVPIQLNEDK